MQPHCINYHTSTKLEGRDGPQSQIFCHTELVGMGKTHYFNELCRSEDPFGLQKDLDAKFIRLTYNETTRYPPLHSPRHGNDSHTTTFARHLLFFHGLSAEETQKVTSLEQGMSLIKKKLGLSNDTIIVVCVDELMKVALSNSTNLSDIGILMRDLLVYQDASIAAYNAEDRIGNRTVFLFSSVNQEMLAAASTASGRQPVTPSFPKLTEDDISNLLKERFKDFDHAAYMKYPWYKLLFQLCVPTPRYALEGLPEALKPVDLRAMEKMPPASLVKLMDRILDISQSACQPEFSRNELNHIVECMLRRELLSGKDQLFLSNKGWLTRSCTLHPLVLRMWADRCAADDCKGKDPTLVVSRMLKEMFEFDFQTIEKAECFAENVVACFEQARRLCSGTTERSLGTLLPGSWAGDDTTLKMKMTTTPPAPMIEVKSFSETGPKEIWKLLQENHIVVSKKRTEKGLECLFPYRCGKEVVCGGVQVKFTSTAQAKGNTCTLMEEALGTIRLPDNVSGFKFGILLSTQQSDHVPNCTSGFPFVFFNGQSLQEYMRPVGPLRLHLEKSMKRPRETDKQEEDERQSRPRN